ncbi:unnamed protein product [Dracunculus medinensis]|uniref:Uncharacterized protein n=1 Tax=Dracunculus medinensis TaxID=318479 RepID=A0A0N4U9Z3_DRAME|nr:unnamed protein product [Dracunculus medinensis]
MGNNADIIAIFGNSDSESDDNELTQKCVKRKKSTETIDRSDSNLISEKESSIESRKFEKINELDNRLSKGSELELEKNELNEKTSSTNSVSPLTISNGDLMMMFVSAVKNLNLDGKTEKANALDHIAPVVLEIMRIAMKKVQANEEVDVGALITEQVRNFLDTDRHNVERLTLCTDVIIPLVQSVILKIRVHDYYDYYEEKNSNKTACKKYSKEEIEKKCLDSKMNKLKRICEERKRKAAEDETNQEESISNVNDKIHQKIISQQVIALMTIELALI